MNRTQIIDRFSHNKLAWELGLLGENPYDGSPIQACLDRWEEPHRYYHGINHLSNLLEQIKELLVPLVWSRNDVDLMEITALFHDIVYDPRSLTNEQDSIDFARNLLYTIGNNPVIDEIDRAIDYTKYSATRDFTKLDANYWVRMFCHLDIDDLKSNLDDNTVHKMVERERNIFKEFQYVDFPQYRGGRVSFLRQFPYFTDSDRAIDVVANFRPRIGVYAGSFLPFHIGHLNILEQAEKVFDKVIIAVGKNPDKVPDRTSIYTAERILPFHEVAHYDGLLSDYLKTLDYADVTVVRGLRSGYDLDYEMTQLRILEDYGCKLPVAYFLCSKDTTHVSSSMIRGLSKFSNGHPEKYIPTKYNYAKKEVK